MTPSHSFAAGKSELELPMAKPLINKTTPIQTRVRETRSLCLGSVGSNGG